MALPESVDLVIPRGKDYLYTLEVVENEDGTEPLDLSGLTLEAHIRVAADEALAAEFTIDMTEAAVGVVHLTLTDTETAALVESRYRYDIFITDDDEMLSRGKITMVEAITHG
jgi:nicotinamidase-related amidase